MKNKIIYLVVGESSGDLLGANLLAALKEAFPEAEFRGIGGPKMQALGLKSCYPMERLSVMGIGPILKRMPELLSMRKNLAAEIIHAKADLFIGIDAPEFNLGLEKKLKQSGVTTVHYVSPSVWAWRKNRIFKIKEAVSLMLCLFPFEKEIYEQHKIPVTVVGHPLARELATFKKDNKPNAKYRRDNTVSLALMPGSRGSEIKYLLPEFINTAKLLLPKRNFLFLLPVAQQKHLQKIRKAIDDAGLSEHFIVEQGTSREMMHAADLVLLASGTATLEAALLRKPMVVAYKVSRFSAWLFRKLLHIDQFALPNLLAGKPVVKEFIQEQCQADNLAHEIERLLENQDLAVEMVSSFESIESALALDSAQLACDAICELLRKKYAK